MIITSSRYALVGYFITPHPTRAHGIIVKYNLPVCSLQSAYVAHRSGKWGEVVNKKYWNLYQNCTLTRKRLLMWSGAPIMLHVLLLLTNVNYWCFFKLCDETKFRGRFRKNWKRSYEPLMHFWRRWIYLWSIWIRFVLTAEAPVTVSWANSMNEVCLLFSGFVTVRRMETMPSRVGNKLSESNGGNTMMSRIH